MIRTLQPGDLLQIDLDLQHHYYFIDFKNNFNDEEILNTFCEFYHRQGRFPGVQRMIIIPRPRLPAFIQTDEAISPIELFEKFRATDARGLVSIQALAALSLFLGGDANVDVATEAMTEFLRNMSHQVLNRENDEISLEFDKLSELKNELIDLCLDKSKASLDFSRNILNRVDQEINDYQFAFDLSLAEIIQVEVDKLISSDEKSPEIKPDFVLPPLITTGKIFDET